jgi:hypothetical protein
MSASAASVTSMSITSGTFAMDDPATAQPFTYINPVTDLVGGYLGTSLAAVNATAPNPGDIASFIFFGKPVHTYTNSTNFGDTNTPAGTQTGGPVPTGDITGTTMTLDMSSWFANWNNSDFNMPGTATGTATLIDAATSTYSYDIAWSGTVVGGSFDGSTGYWTLQGTAIAPVPEASTYGMMLAGLGLVGFAVRRRKLMA